MPIGSFNARSHHLHIMLNYNRNAFLSGRIRFQLCRDGENVSDALTKANKNPRHTKFAIDLLGEQDMTATAFPCHSYEEVINYYLESQRSSKSSKG